MGALFEVIETSEYVCPKCGSALEKVTRPVNVQVFACTNDDCEMEYGEGYLTGWHDATVAMLASRPTPCAVDTPSALCQKCGLPLVAGLGCIDCD